MGFTTDFLTGLAEQLAAAGIGAWSTTAAYTAAQTGIVLNVVPQAPDAVIVLGGYSISDDSAYGDTVQGVQVRTRTAGLDPRPTDDLADQIFDLWHGRHDFLVASRRVVLAERTSWTPLGADGSRRHERSDNYAFTVHRPSPYRG